MKRTGKRKKRRKSAAGTDKEIKDQQFLLDMETCRINIFTGKGRSEVLAEADLQEEKRIGYFLSWW